MPIYTPEQKQRLYAHHGLRPEEYDIDEVTNEFVPKFASTPDPSTAPETTTVLQQKPEVKNTPTMVESALRSANESALPTTVALGAGAGTLALSSWLGGPVTGVPITAAALLASLGAGMGASKVQRDIIPQKIQDAAFTRPEDYATNPIATAAGGFIPSAAFFNPAKGIQDLPKLASGLSKLPAALGPVGRTALTTAEEQALLNAALNTIPQAGISTVEQLRSGQPFDVGRLAAETLPGVLQTRPTGLGKKLGFTDPISDAELARLFPTQPEIDITTTGDTAAPPLSAEEQLRVQGARVPNELEPRDIKLTPQGVSKAEKTQYGMKGLKFRDEPTLMERAVERMESEGGPVTKPTPEEIAEPSVSTAEAELQTLRKKIDDIEQTNKDFVTIVKNLTGSEPTARPSRGEEGVGEVKAQELERGLVTESPESKQKLFQRQSDEALLKEAQSDVASLTPDQRSKLQRALRQEAYRRGFKIEDVPSVVGKEGKPIAGNIDLPKRRIQISKELGGHETVGHEAAGHGFLDDLLNSSSAADRVAAIEAINAYTGGKQKFKSTEEWRDFVKSNPEEAYLAANSIEETLAKDVALEGYRQSRTTAFGSRMDRVKQWWGNTKSRWKKEFGLATEEDMRKHLVARFRGDAPYGTRTELAPKAGNVGNIRFSDSSEIDKNLKKKLRTAIDFGDRVLVGDTPNSLHYSIYEKELKNRGIEPESPEADKLLGDIYEAHRAGFVDESGNFLTRNEAASYTGTKSVEPRYDSAMMDDEGKVRQNVVNRVNKLRQSSDSELPKGKTDYQQYLDVQRKISEKIKAGDYDSEEFKALWQENENIKNRHGGMPPKPDAPETSRESEEGKLISFKDQLDAKLEQSLEEAKEVFKQTGVKMGDILYTDSGTQFKIISPTVHYNRIKGTKEYDKSNPLVFVEQMSSYKGNDEGIGSKSTAYLNKLHIDNPNETKTRESSAADLTKGIEDQLGEASFRASTKASKLQTEAKKNSSKVFDIIRDEISDLIAQEHAVKFPEGDKPVDPKQEATDFIYGKNEDKLRSIYGDELVDELSERKFSRIQEFKEIKNTADRDVEASFETANKKAEELEAFTRTDVERQSEEAALSRKDYEENAPDHPSSYSFFGTTTSRLDKIAEKIKTPTAKEVTYKLRQANTERDILEGRVGNKLAAEMMKNTPEEVMRVREYRHAIDNDFPAPFELSPSEQDLKKRLDAVYKDIGQRVIDSGLQVRTGDKFRAMKLRPQGYQENMPAQKVVDAWLENKPEAAKYDREFIEHAKKKGESEKEAKKILEEYKQHVGNAGVTPDTKFGAIRRMEGIGLPWSLVEQNGIVSARRYGKRVATDLAFFKYLQNDPRMLKALNLRDQFGNSYETSPIAKDVNLDDVQHIGSAPEVVAAMRSIQGIDLPTNPVVQSLARVVGANIMQTGTAIRNLAALPTSIAPYYGVNVKSVMQAIGKMHERTNRAFENNAIKTSYKDFDAAGAFEGNPNKFVSVADKYVDFMRKYTGRDLSDKMEGLFSYSLGEELAGNWFAQAKNGDLNARAMLNRFGTTVEGGVKKKFLDRAAKITEDDIARVAKEFTDVVRGSYSASGLPSAAIEGPVAPFLALSRWSIERANNFYRDAVLPIKERGDYMPLLKTSLSALVSGAVIEQINEALNNKRGGDPTVSEVLKSGNKEALIAKAIGLAQLGALGGIASDAMKFGANIAQGKDAAFASPVSFPLATVTEDVAKKTAFMVEAIRGGEDPFMVLGEYMKELVRTQSQNSRYVMNRVGEDATKKEKFRDLRVFKELTGREVSSARGEANPFLNLRAKEFKKEEDLGKAIGADLPSLLDDIVSRADGDFEKLKKELEGLKRNSYQIFPSLGDNPRTAAEYYDYLVETQGKNKADERLKEFLEVAKKNSIKSSFVPSL